MIVMVGKRLGGVGVNTAISVLGFMIIMYQRIYAEDNFMSAYDLNKGDTIFVAAASGVFGKGGSGAKKP